ncbi:uncharacterized protein YraI [Rhodococcus opacus]|nr:uncharacterized protein YraI [Rhodococcus opacus]
MLMVIQQVRSMYLYYISSQYDWATVQRAGINWFALRRAVAAFRSSSPMLPIGFLTFPCNRPVLAC